MFASKHVQHFSFNLMCKTIKLQKHEMPCMQLKMTLKVEKLIK